MKKVRPMSVGVACVVALAVAAPLALAATTQEEERNAYKAQVEPICKQNAKANENILAGVRAKVKSGKLAAAGQQFLRASTALQSTLRQLKAVPGPAADQQRLNEWLKHIGEEATLLQKIGKALKAGNRHSAEVLSTKLVSGARLTNALVVAFGFHYCRFEPSKYT